MMVLTILLAVLVAGSLVYCVLIVVAACRYLLVSPPAPISRAPISVLKPLCGLDEGLEENLRSFFVQDYAQFEILFAVHRADDPAVAVVEKVKSEFAGKIETRLIVSGDSPIPNAKAFSLNQLVREAHHNLLVMTDSDVRVTPGFLARLGAELQDAQVGMITCPYRAVEGPSRWSRLEAIGINTEFIGGVLVARMIEGMKFALGCTIAIRRTVLDAMGGFDYLKEFLAEDFVMGQRAAELGFAVLFSSYVIEHRIGSSEMRQSLSHRLRWTRSTRRSRPAGYWGQMFTYPLPWALLLWAVHGAAWPVVLLVVFFRAGAAWATAVSVLHDPLTRKHWWLLPIQDVLGFLVWIGGFAGDTIVWRDRNCTVLPDGRLQVNP